MRLLLAGGTGLIGGEVLRLGLKNGHEITTIGRRPTGMASSEIVSSFDDLPRLPPADIAIGQSSVMHYTWGAIISNKEDHEVWRFDKREYLGSWDSLKKIEPLPPWDAEQEFKLQDKKRIQKSQYEVLDKMVEIFNEAVDAVVAGDG